MVLLEPTFLAMFLGNLRGTDISLLTILPVLPEAGAKVLTYFTELIAEALGFVLFS